MNVKNDFKVQSPAKGKRTYRENNQTRADAYAVSLAGKRVNPGRNKHLQSNPVDLSPPKGKKTFKKTQEFYATTQVSKANASPLGKPPIGKKTFPDRQRPSLVPCATERKLGVRTIIDCEPRQMATSKKRTYQDAYLYEVNKPSICDVYPSTDKRDEKVKLRSKLLDYQ